MKGFSLSLIFIASSGLIHADWSEKIKPHGNYNQVAKSSEKLEYEMSWNGAIKSGQLVFEFGKPDKRYPKAFLTQVYGRSTGVASAAFPYQFTFTSFARLSTYQPILFVAEETDRGEKITTRNRFYNMRLQHNSEVTPLKGGAVEVRKHQFKEITAHDIVSAYLALRAQPLKDKQIITMCIQAFASPYLAEVTVLGHESYHGQNCIKLDIKLQKIDRKTRKLLDYKKLKNATLWLSDDAQRVPVELRSKVFIGDVRARLVKRGPLPK